jgi:hypothetical protein
MSPVQIIEGTRKLDPVSERNLAERRFAALAAASLCCDPRTRRSTVACARSAGSSSEGLG